MGEAAGNEQGSLWISNESGIFKVGNCLMEPDGDQISLKICFVLCEDLKKLQLRYSQTQLHTELGYAHTTKKFNILKIGNIKSKKKKSQTTIWC